MFHHQPLTNLFCCVGWVMESAGTEGNSLSRTDFIYCCGAVTEVLRFGPAHLNHEHKVLFLVIPGQFAPCSDSDLPFVNSYCYMMNLCIYCPVYVFQHYLLIISVVTLKKKKHVYGECQESQKSKSRMERMGNGKNGKNDSNEVGGQQGCNNTRIETEIATLKATNLSRGVRRQKRDMPFLTLRSNCQIEIC